MDRIVNGWDSNMAMLRRSDSGRATPTTVVSRTQEGAQSEPFSHVTHPLNERTPSPLRLGGVLVISLDFELYWGWRQRVHLSALNGKLRGARAVIPRLLTIFEEHKLHVTWATVGLLFLDGREHALANLPLELPEYDDARFSPYRHIDSTGTSETIDPYHYARSLISQIRDTPHQEIGSHTFSHFYCLERGASLSAFHADLAAAARAAESVGVRLRSIVFPANQVNEAFLDACHEEGLFAYRGTGTAWPYFAVSSGRQNVVRRAVRFLDSYINLTGRHTYKPTRDRELDLVNIPASRYLRPYNPKLRLFERWKLRRVKDDMTAAAREGHVYHLWWHPEEFGEHSEMNLSQLRRLAEHFVSLRELYGMRTMTMAEVAVDTRRADAE